MLSLSVLNGVESACNYEQKLQAGQTYYAYNPSYPYADQGENNCTWKSYSPYIISIKCSINMVSLFYEYFVGNFYIDTSLIGCLSTVYQFDSLSNPDIDIKY